MFDNLFTPLSQLEVEVKSIVYLQVKSSSLFSSKKWVNTKAVTDTELIPQAAAVLDLDIREAPHLKES